jgi:hypothetical protein
MGFMRAYTSGARLIGRFSWASRLHLASCKTGPNRTTSRLLSTSPNSTARRQLSVTNRRPQRIVRRGKFDRYLAKSRYASAVGLELPNSKERDFPSYWFYWVAGSDSNRRPWSYESYFNRCIQRLPKNKQPFPRHDSRLSRKHLGAYRAGKITASL